MQDMAWFLGTAPPVPADPEEWESTDEEEPRGSVVLRGIDFRKRKCNETSPDSNYGQRFCAAV